MNLPYRLLKTAGIVLLALIALVVAALLALRFLLAPNIDYFRPQIEQRLSAETGQNVSIKKLAIDWAGIVPRLRLSQLQIAESDTGKHTEVSGDSNSAPLLSIGEAFASADWKQALHGRLDPAWVEIRDIHLNVTRDRMGRIWALGRRLDSDNINSTPTAVDAANLNLEPVSDLLERLPDMTVLNGSVSWNDATRAEAGPFTLSDFTLQLNRNGGKRILSASARLPKAAGQSIQMLGNLQQDTSAAGHPATWSGHLRVSVIKLDMMAARPWFDIPEKVKSGSLSHAVVDMEVVQNLPRDMVVAYGLENIRVEDHVRNHEFVIAADSLTARLSSSFTSVINEFNRWRLPETQLPAGGRLQYRPVRFESTVKGFYYKDAVVFENPIHIDQASVAGNFGRDDQQEPKVNFDRASVANEDLQLQGKGSWRFDENSDNGIVDLTGTLGNVSLPNLHNYLPNVMDADARQWLKSAFEKGRLSDAQFRLNGVVDDFPYGLAPDAGHFLLEGSYENLLLNYHQKDIRGKRWPVVNSDNGRIHFRNDEIIIDSAQAFYAMPEGQRLNLDSFHGVVSSLEKNTTVDIQASARGRAEDFLTFTHISPLGDLINNVLDEAEASGQWTIPLTLHIPVLDADNSTISGSIQFDNSRFRLTPDFPWASALRGVMTFNESELMAKSVTGTMLGGKVVLDGPIGTPGKPLSIQGDLTAEGLKEMIPVRGMNRITGGTTYTSLVHFFTGGRVKVDFKSNLAGLAMRFPDGMGKPAAARWPTTITWRPAEGNRDNGKRYLEINIEGSRTQAIFEHDINTERGPYFSRGTIGMRRPARLGSAGLTILAKNPTVDTGAWEEVTEEFSDRTAGGDGRQTLPDVSRVEIDSDALRIKDQTLTAARLMAQKDGKQWALTLSSDQAMGSGTWVPASGKSDSGSLVVRLDSLNVIRSPSQNANSTDTAGNTAAGTGTDTSSSAKGKTSRLPRLDLAVKKLTVYGMEMGQLILKGYQPAGSDDWKLDYFSLVNPGGSLAAQGSVSQQGRKKDLDMKGKIVVSDLGKFLETYQLGGVIQNGKGTIDMDVAWKNMQDMDIATLNGNLNAELKDGRLESVKSSAVKALELLSLQSFRRLPRFGQTLGNSMQEGLSFDTVRSRLRFDSGRLFVDDFRLNGPSSAIVASGMTNLKTENLDFQAVVVPKLDVSGASVLAGTIVNPAVGVGAFLTQWLLQAPLQRALTMRYHVTGNWTEPLLNDVPLPSETELKASDPDARIDDLYRSH